MTGGQAVSMHRRLLALLASTAVLIAACSGGAATVSPSEAPSAAASEAAPSEAAPPSEAAAEPVTIEFYDLHINEPGKSLIAQVIQEFEAAHPNVTIKPTILENEALKTKIATEMQAGNPPDLFQSWGGGVLAQQVEAGLVRPIDDEIADWKDSINAGRHEHLPGRRQAIRHPVQLRTGGLLVQQGPLR